MWLTMIVLFLTNLTSTGQDRYVLPKMPDTQLQSLQFSRPNPEAQVIPPNIYESLGSEKSAVDSINLRLTGIDESIKDLRTDIKPLQETATVVNFLLGGFKVLVGLVIGVVFTGLVNRYRKSVPSSGPTASP